MVKVFFFPLSPNVMSWTIVIQSAEDIFYLTSFSVAFFPHSCCTPLTIFFFTLKRVIIVQSAVSSSFTFKPTLQYAVCSWPSSALFIYCMILTSQLSSTGAASSSECGQTSVPWDYSLLPVNHTPGVGTLLFVLWMPLMFNYSLCRYFLEVV